MELLASARSSPSRCLIAQTAKKSNSVTIGSCGQEIESMPVAGPCPSFPTLLVYTHTFSNMFATFCHCLASSRMICSSSCDLFSDHWTAWGRQSLLINFQRHWTAKGKMSSQVKELTFDWLPFRHQRTVARAMNKTGTFSRNGSLLQWLGIGTPDDVDKLLKV